MPAELKGNGKPSITSSAVMWNRTGTNAIVWKDGWRPPRQDDGGPGLGGSDAGGSGQVAAYSNGRNGTAPKVTAGSQRNRMGYCRR